MEIALTLEQKDGSKSLTFAYTRMVNAGYVGRDQTEVRRHIEELAKKGIPGPETTPTLYPVIGRMLVKDSEIEVFGEETCGEVEYVLLIENEHTVYVGLGSDHTDRHLEETDIPRAKQICPNLIGQKVWPLAEVEAHWDDLIIRSKMLKEGRETLYQEGPLQLILDPKGLMGFVKSKVVESLDGTIIFSGTLGSLTGGFVYGERFMAELVDPGLNRSLDLKYDVRVLDYVAEE